MQHADLAFLRMAVNLFSQAYRYGKPNESSGGAVDKYFSRDLPLPISFNQEEGNQVTSCLLQSSVLQTLKKQRRRPKDHCLSIDHLRSHQNWKTDAGREPHDLEIVNYKLVPHHQNEVVQETKGYGITQ